MSKKNKGGWKKLRDKSLIEEAKEKEQALIDAGKTPITLAEKKKIDEYERLINQTRAINNHYALRVEQFKAEASGGTKSAEELQADTLKMEKNKKQVSDLLERLNVLQKELDQMSKARQEKK